MNQHAKLLAQLLVANRNIVTAWFDDPEDPKQLHISHATNTAAQQITITEQLTTLELIEHTQEPLRTLITHASSLAPQNENQNCQDEPILLGCQIQPERANWVGTAGSPIHWRDKNDVHHFGILSNWHVMASGYQQQNRTIHQPTTSRPPMAYLSEWAQVLPNETNLIDAAIADALVDGYHSIAPHILEIGRPERLITDATKNMAVCKSGRTTGHTTAHCVATGAAARVSYGAFTAVFEDQDIFESTGAPFSAAGDSGSLILTCPTNHPVALLFAGGGNQTIGNPIRHVAHAFNLAFGFA